MSGMPKQAFTAIPGPVGGVLRLVLAAAVACALAACSAGGERSSGQTDALRQEGSALFGSGAPRSASDAQPGARGAGAAESTRSSDEPAASEAWSIVLATFRGEGQTDAARIALRRMQTEGRLPQAFMQRRGPATSIAFGRYDGPESPEAQRELKRIQEMSFNGLRPYWIAYIAPPYKGVMIGSRPEYNLLGAKARFGSNALYTLQVAAYGRDDLAHPTEEDLAEARKKAEEAAAILRQEGEAAFYYHGDRLSMVTIGVFDSSDFDPQAPGVQSARLREARERHPYNLYNGQGIRVRVRGSDKWQMQRSTLVSIPEK